MGQRMDKDEIVYGDDCLWCFDAGETPKYVYARFLDIGKCPGEWCEDNPLPPNDRVFKLTQDDMKPCTWVFQDGFWDVVYHAYWPGIAGCALLINYMGDWSSYFRSVFPFGVSCKTFFTNEEECADGTCGVGGYGIVTSKLEALEVMASLNIKPAYDLFMEMRPLSDGKRVYKFCKLKDAMNIAILFEPE